MSKVTPIAAAYQNLLSKGRLKPNPGQAALADQLSQLQQNLLDRNSSFWKRKNSQYRNGIYIFGGVGTGKSRIADLFATTLPKTISSKRIHFYEFMADVHLRLHQARSQPTYDGDPLLQIGRDIYSQSSVLCFDEFQVSDIADAMILKRLFGSYWDRGGIMVSTSNRHPTELYLNGLNRSLFLPFIHEMQHRCLVWKMEGDEDYRLGGSKTGRTPVFFTDANAFDEVFQKATHGSELNKLDIRVRMNRSLRVLATQSIQTDNHNSFDSTKAVAYSSFAELCKASLGASDYHALCNFAHTIFLPGLRSFGADELDVVRRFITLVDIAYESRTRIVCLSDVPLGEVFNKIGVALPKDISPNTTEKNLTIKGEGGSSSSMMSTFINDMEWSATGLIKASLATGGAGETDVRFAIGRALSRLSEMESASYGVIDD